LTYYPILDIGVDETVTLFWMMSIYLSTKHGTEYHTTKTHG